MRLRLPGRSPGTTDDAPTGFAASPADDAALEPDAEITDAPAPTEGRGPKLQRASRKLAIASAQFLLIAAAVVVLFWVLGKLWSILLPIVLGLLIATVLWPATRFLRRHRWPPALAASTVLLAAIAILVGIIAAMTPTKIAMAATRTVEAARAGGHRCLRRNRVAGQSTVAIRRPRTIGSRIDHSLPSTQNSTTTAAAISRNWADAIARVRAARCTFGPRPSGGAGASVTSAPGSAAGAVPEADVDPGNRTGGGPVSSLERPGRRSLMRSIRTQGRGADRSATIIGTKS